MFLNGRTCTVTGKVGKPTIIVTKEFRVYIGNEHSSEIAVAGELFGFNTGTYEVRVVQGKRDGAGLPFRLNSDKDLVIFNRTPIPLCKLMHRIITEKGLADLQMKDHELQPKMLPADICLQYGVVTV